MLGSGCTPHSQVRMVETVRMITTAGVVVMTSDKRRASIDMAYAMAKDLGVAISGPDATGLFKLRGRRGYELDDVTLDELLHALHTLERDIRK